MEIFIYGLILGSGLMLIAQLFIPFLFVSPKEWKRREKEFKENRRIVRMVMAFRKSFDEGGEYSELGVEDLEEEMTYQYLAAIKKTLEWYYSVPDFFQKDDEDFIDILWNKSEKLKGAYVEGYEGEIELAMAECQMILWWIAHQLNLSLPQAVKHKLEENKNEKE